MELSKLSLDAQMESSILVKFAFELNCLATSDEVDVFVLWVK